MAAVIQKVVKFAEETFVNRSKGPLFHDKLTKLTKMMKQVTAADVNFDHELVADATVYKYTWSKAPVVYVPIWEDNIVSIGIFVLRHGVSLPLHDHPNMYGICKVIHGTLQVKQYSTILRDKNVSLPNEILSKFTKLEIEKHVKFVGASQVGQFTTESDPCLLTPSDGNFHEISSLQGPAAFLDVLSPPYNYDEGLVCHFYAELPVTQEKSNQKQDGTWLIEIPQPADYWTQTSPYNGPEVYL